MAASKMPTCVLSCQELVEPFLDDGLAVAAGYTDDGDVEAGAVPSGEGLEREQRVLHLEEVGFGEVSFYVFAHHEGTDASLVEVGNVEVTVAHVCLYGEEKSRFGVAEATAVGQQPVYFATVKTIGFGTDERCYFECSVH